MVKISLKNIKQMTTLTVSFYKPKIRFKNSARGALIMADLNQIRLCQRTAKVKLINYLELKILQDFKWIIKLIKSKETS